LEFQDITNRSPKQIIIDRIEDMKIHIAYIEKAREDEKKYKRIPVNRLTEQAELIVNLEIAIAVLEKTLSAMK
jgi:hypothetical protein